MNYKLLYVFFILPLLFCTKPMMAQEYNAMLIPPELREGADAVIRNESVIIEIKNANEVGIIHKKAITILHPNGRYLGAIQVNYNKSRPIHSIEARLYNAGGKLIRRYKKSDFEDVSSVEDFSLFEDDREKRLLPVVSSYPFTIEYQYEQKYKFSLYLPKWLPVVNNGVAVQQSVYSVSAPENVRLRYYYHSLQAPDVDSSDRKNIHYTWKINNRQASSAESFSPPVFLSDMPIAIVSPATFKYYGMKGNFHNWKEYGKWVCEHLLKGRDELSEQTVNHIRRMTKNLSSPKEIAKKVYEYAQHKNRYISIQVGKGGFEPMKASEVDKVSYGDCKALVNYMKALLKAVGIPSYYTEVYGGDQNISLRPDFASAAQGNHIILCVPFGEDTTWLECTNKYMPFGYLGSFTDNRNVVICTPEGGILTRTTKYSDSVNREKRTAQFKIDSIGNLTGEMTTDFGGLLYEERQFFEPLSFSEKLQQAKEVYPFLQMKISGYKLEYHKHALPSVKEKITFTNPRYAAISEEGLSIPLNPVSRIPNIPNGIKDRKNKVYIPRGYIVIDSLTYILPQKYTVKYAPKNIHIHTQFGDYTVYIKTEKDRLAYTRSFQIKSGFYPVESYPALVGFLQQVSDYDRRKFLVVKTQNNK